MILGQNLFLVCESQTIFCSIRNVLENYDLGKRHKIWAKLHCPHIFWLVRQCDQLMILHSSVTQHVCYSNVF